MTGTHGGGTENKAIATYVTRVAFIDANGGKRTLTRGIDADFALFLHSFGTLGIIYEMTMEVVTEYGVKKCIYQNVPWDFLKDKKVFDKLNENMDFVSFFTDWQ